MSIQKWPFSAISASICGVGCAAYHLYASAQPLDFLDLAKNCSFLNWTLLSARFFIYGWALTRLLSELGHDVLQVRDKDPRMTDDDILSWAVREKRIVVTTDNDFEEMIWRQGRTHCGVLRLENLPRSERMALFHDVLDRHGRDLESATIVIASSKKFRVRRVR